VKTFWTQFGTNVVDHHMHEEGVFSRYARFSDTSASP